MAGAFGRANSTPTRAADLFDRVQANIGFLIGHDRLVVIEGLQTRIGYAAGMGPEGWDIQGVSRHT